MAVHSTKRRLWRPAEMAKQRGWTEKGLGASLEGWQCSPAINHVTAKLHTTRVRSAVYCMPWQPVGPQGRPARWPACPGDRGRCGRDFESAGLGRRSMQRTVARQGPWKYAGANAARETITPTSRAACSGAARMPGSGPSKQMPMLAGKCMVDQKSGYESE